jgi:hypothetical protein
MARTDILRRAPRTLRAMGDQEQYAPVPREPEEDSPKWLELTSAKIRDIKNDLRLLRGLSDRNRYKYRASTVDVMDKILHEDLRETMETFRTGKGNRSDFDLRDYLTE